MRIDWARHGQNVANLTETFSHRVYDGDLTELGRQQAHRLGERLAAEGRSYTRLVTSPLRRAVQTAEIVAGYLGIEIAATMDDLRELDVGELDGRNDQQAWAVYNAVLRSWRDGDRTARFPGGEDCHELVARLRTALATVTSDAGTGPALVVAHGANIRAALPTMTGSPDPGTDLVTGGLAGLDVTSTSIALRDWGTGSRRHGY
ncbi:histidine phosphatase family protein [Pseudonocardiaceae bacterium YIM PH 21723]|nr:histidine phosphatase family protein [Pseudonocardiaceae bacterium YIM PH 21723]